METSLGKPSFLRNTLVRIFLFGVFVIALRFAYVVTIRGESCDVGDFCFFSVPSENLNVVVSTVKQVASSSSSAISSSSSLENTPATPNKVPGLWMTKDFQRAVQFYSSIFQTLLSESVLRTNHKTLCVDTQNGADVFALRELGVEDSIGVNKKGLKPLMVRGQGSKLPFKNETFDFVFCGIGVMEKSLRPGDLAAEIDRTMKVEGFLVIHTVANDMYSLASLDSLFSSFKFLSSKVIDGDFDGTTPFLREVVLEKKVRYNPDNEKMKVNECTEVPVFKRELISNAEPLIEKEPEKPWITLKKNAQNIKHLSSMVDISFKPRYVYVDIGSRSYGSSIVSWFKKQYPKQNKTFEIYAIEADSTFHDQYKNKKGITLLPYAAWVKNESLFFEINEDPGHKEVAKGRGMGRIKPVQLYDGLTSSGKVDEIKGFDFADWLKNTFTERDYVVMKMDVEGTEFDLIPRLFETGAICLIDELFLECHYNRWQRCCPGERTKKYEKTYGQCLDLFTSLRNSGVLVHQWW